MLLWLCMILVVVTTCHWAALINVSSWIMVSLVFGFVGGCVLDGTNLEIWDFCLAQSLVLFLTFPFPCRNSKIFFSQVWIPKLLERIFCTCVRRRKVMTRYPILCVRQDTRSYFLSCDLFANYRGTNTNPTYAANKSLLGQIYSNKFWENFEFLVG